MINLTGIEQIEKFLLDNEKAELIINKKYVYPCRECYLINYSKHISLMFFMIPNDVFETLLKNDKIKDRIKLI